jgi:hypothetical protein
MTPRGGDSFFQSNMTAPGAIGVCSTEWQVNFYTPGYEAATNLPRPVRQAWEARHQQLRVAA